MASPKIACVLLMSLVVLSAPIAQAITCGQVSGSVAGCIPYLRGGLRIPPAGCCTGLRSLNSVARTPADRRAACICLTRAANSMTGLNYGLAAGLPGKCGINIPYNISPNTDCNKIG